MNVRLLAWLSFVIFSGYLRKADSSSGIRCDSYELVQYRLTFIGDWSEDKFPKQYPKFRPHAQWSKLIGRTHNDDYNLWSIGNLATSAFKKFAQEAASDDLDKRETQGFNGIFDTFIAPAINSGIGETAVDVFVSRTHSMVSAAVRLIPSPDWFVGVNAIQLCPNGTWLNEETVPLDPIDAGTDRGYTFTSPKWASRPRQAMHRITSKFPNHRANSFYYPELDQLPHIAFVKFELLTSNKQHKIHRQVGHRRPVEADSDESDPEKKREELEEQQILHGEPLLPGNGNDDERMGRPSAPQPSPLRKAPSAAAVRLRAPSPPAPTPQKLQKPTSAQRKSIVPATTLDEEDEDDDEDDEVTVAPKTTTRTTTTKRHPRTTPKSAQRARDARPIDSNRLANDQSRPDSRQKPAQSTVSKDKKHHGQQQQQQRHQGQQQQQHQNPKSHHRVHNHQRRDKLEERQDCQVGDWGHWSACSKTCGFGAQKRHRKVIQPPKNGRPCPSLQQEKWCGSMRACRDEQKLFSWLQNENDQTKRQGRA